MRRLLRRRAIVAALVVLVPAAVGGGLGCALGAPVWRGAMTQNFDGRRFHNVPHGEEHGFKDVLKWMSGREPGEWGEPRGAAFGPPPPRSVRGGALRVTWVGHSTALVQLDGVNILTDPVWSERASPVSWAGPRRVRPPGVRFEDLPPIHVVLVSHNHYDHMDLPTLRRLAQEHRPRVFTPLGNAKTLARGEVPGATELDWWQSEALPEGVRITAVPARHFSSRSINDRNNSLWAGFVVSGPSGDVYFAGDTGWGDHFREIGERFPGIRLALIPIGAFRPEWFMGPVHVSPADAVRAHQQVGAQQSMGIHFGTFPLADDGESEPVERLRGALADARLDEERFVVPEPGKGWDVPGAQMGESAATER